MTPLATYRIADYALVLDLLGTAQRMADHAEWLRALLELLDTIDASLSAAATTRFFQHGDTIVLVSDDPNVLATSGTTLLTTLFSKDILAQVGLAGGGCYYDDQGFGKARRNPKARLQSLVGQAIARAHLVLRNIKGPRFIIDEESTQLPAAGVGTRYLRSPQHRPANAPTGRAVSELRWWTSLPNPLPTVRKRMTIIDRDISSLTADRNGDLRHMAVLIDRDIESLKKRREHWQTFDDILADDP